jgi:hypothetical protein
LAVNCNRNEFSFIETDLSCFDNPVIFIPNRLHFHGTYIGFSFSGRLPPQFMEPVSKNDTSDRFLHVENNVDAFVRLSQFPRNVLNDLRGPPSLLRELLKKFLILDDIKWVKLDKKMFLHIG